ncbi:hypothetical protein ES702_07584 [subsurface metagenome]
MDFPRKINLGSGKTFLKEYINIDIDRKWKPDIRLDLNLSIMDGRFRVFDTKRFGAVRFEKGLFDEILAVDVLEHIDSLTVCMKSCLDLLKMGGFLEIVVPYDLSLGAWQDPYHVRAFNQNSWLYYTKWSWYLGWEDEMFFLNKLEFKLSDLGSFIKENGMELQEIVNVARAVDGMKVQLKKVAFQPEEK